MFRMLMCWVAIFLGAMGCRNREPPARMPEAPPAPSSSVAPAAATGPVENLGGQPLRKTQSHARVGRIVKTLPQ